MKVSIDGVVMPAEAARVSVFDRGFLFGDSVYEVFRTVRGHPLFWPDHLVRLQRSAELLHLPIAPVLEPLRAWVDALIADFGPTEQALRLIVTRGVGELSLDPGTATGTPTVVIITRPLSPPDPDLYAHGCVLAALRMAESGLDPRAKSGSRLPQVLAQGEVQAAGAYEGLRLDVHGQILEGLSSTFFLVCAGEVLTPPLSAGILAGITRRKVQEVAASLCIPLHERGLFLHDLERAEEAFITSSTRGLVPARACGSVSWGAPGPVTRRLMQGYEALVEGWPEQDRG